MKRRAMRGALCIILVLAFVMSTCGAAFAVADRATELDAIEDYQNYLETIINNYGAYAQSIGAVVPYDISITVPDEKIVP